MDQQRMRRGCAKNVETNDTHRNRYWHWEWANWNYMFRVLLLSAFSKQINDVFCRRIMCSHYSYISLCIFFFCSFSWQMQTTHKHRGPLMNVRCWRYLISHLICEQINKKPTCKMKKNERNQNQPTAPNEEMEREKKTNNQRACISRKNDISKHFINCR